MQHGGSQSRNWREKKLIETVYEELKKLGAVRSKDQFSSEWLGMEKSYMRVMKAKGRQPSARVVATCAARLRSHGKHLMADERHGFQFVASSLDGLAERCIRDMIERYEVSLDAHQ
jgi:hypothetical protein